MSLEFVCSSLPTSYSLCIFIECAVFIPTFTLLIHEDGLSDIERIVSILDVYINKTREKKKKKRERRKREITLFLNQLIKNLKL